MTLFGDTPDFAVVNSPAGNLIANLSAGLAGSEVETDIMFVGFVPTLVLAFTGHTLTYTSVLVVQFYADAAGDTPLTQYSFTCGQLCDSTLLVPTIGPYCQIILANESAGAADVNVVVALSSAIIPQPTSAVHGVLVSEASAHFAVGTTTLIPEFIAPGQVGFAASFTAGTVTFQVVDAATGTVFYNSGQITATVNSAINTTFLVGENQVLVEIVNAGASAITGNVALTC